MRHLSAFILVFLSIHSANAEMDTLSQPQLTQTELSLYTNRYLVELTLASKIGKNSQIAYGFGAGSGYRIMIHNTESGLDYLGATTYASTRLYYAHSFTSWLRVNAGLSWAQDERDYPYGIYTGIEIGNRYLRFGSSIGFEKLTQFQNIDPYGDYVLFITPLTIRFIWPMGIAP